MKKYLSILTAILFIFSLSSCFSTGAFYGDRPPGHHKRVNSIKSGKKQQHGSIKKKNDKHKHPRKKYRH